MIGIIVSGRAVPTAARTEPTAPSASSSLRPNHSMPLVNSSAPARMMTKATTRIEDVHRSDRRSDGGDDADGDDRAGSPIETPTIGQLAVARRSRRAGDDDPADRRRDARPAGRATGTPPGRRASDVGRRVGPRSKAGPPVERRDRRRRASGRTPTTSRPTDDVGDRDQQPADQRARRSSACGASRVIRAPRSEHLRRPCRAGRRTNSSRRQPQVDPMAEPRADASRR